MSSKSPAIQPITAPHLQQLNNPGHAPNSQESGPTHIVKWTLTPPHGVRFVNEFGSECSVQFPLGMEEEVFQTIMHQLHQQLTQSLQARQGEPDTVPPPKDNAGE